MLVHHIGYYVTDLEESKNKFECLGYRVEQDAVYDSQRGIKVLFLIGESVRIELIEIVDIEQCEIAHMGHCRKLFHITFVMRWAILIWQ